MYQLVTTHCLCLKQKSCMKVMTNYGNPLSPPPTSQINLNHPLSFLKAQIHNRKEKKSSCEIPLPPPHLLCGSLDYLNRN